MSYEIPIEAGKIREFARATQSRSDDHVGPDAIITPTFLATARLVWQPAEENPLAGISLDMRRVLHAEEEYRFSGRVPRAGETLTVTAAIGDEWTKVGKRGGTMRFLTTVNEFRDSSGALVAEQITTLVETAKAPEQ
jgi:hypothetical protein